MSRSKAFTPEHEPLADNADLVLRRSRVLGPFSFLNPTQAPFEHVDAESKGPTLGARLGRDEDREQDEDASRHKDDLRHAPITFYWRSRDNRKGRHLLRVRPDQLSAESTATSNAAVVQFPEPTTDASKVLRGILRLFTTFRPWDISWLVAQIFTWGSAVWVLNAFFVFLPLTNPSTEFPNEILYGGGVTAFIGAIIFFETGSILLMVEAINENRDGCFGYAVENVIAGLQSSSDEDQQPKAADSSQDSKLVQIEATASCKHHHLNKKNLVGKGSDNATPDLLPSQSQSADEREAKNWQWVPSWYDLRTHYLHELGFLACSAQLFGATIFGISGFTALPGIQNHLNQSVLNGVYWIPQMVGGSGFVVSGTLFMLETQKKWYLPAFDVLGWHIGFWNLIGALGFTLSGAVGPAYGNSGAQFQAACATFWGSWAFLVASVLQLYESIEKHPVELVKG